MSNIKWIFLLLLVTNLNAQIQICSWNLQNFGKSKSDSSIVFIANILRNYDVVAIQEVVAGNGGAQAVARLADKLQRTGAKWDYSVSPPTSGTPNRSERYAFLWKTSKIKKIGEAFLESTYSIEIDREPYMCTFQYDLKQFTLFNFHAIPRKQQPETEIKYFKFYRSLYPNLNITFLGDFNCPQSHSVFTPLKKMGYRSVFQNQKTSLRMECHGLDCLASEYDNIWYDSTKIKMIRSDLVQFFKSFKTLKWARKISDHLPVGMLFFLI